MLEFVNRIIEGDCMEILKLLPDHCIDMVLCDLPYGTTQNLWDLPLDLAALWGLYKRVVKPNGAIVLTGQGEFTGMLIQSNRSWFRYKIVWIKSSATNFLNANKQPLRRHEDICVFYNDQPYYHPKKIKGVPYDKGIRKDNRSGTYGKYNPAKITNADGLRYPSDVIFFEEDLIDWVHFGRDNPNEAYHPTQKPVNLGRWLIQTYTRPGELVLDNACGSGSFLVSAVLENRKFLGIEKNDQSYHLQGQKVDYIAICKKRVMEALYNKGKLFEEENE